MFFELLLFVMILGLIYLCFLLPITIIGTIVNWHIGTYYVPYLFIISYTLSGLIIALNFKKSKSRSKLIMLAHIFTIMIIYIMHLFGQLLMQYIYDDRSCMFTFYTFIMGLGASIISIITLIVLSFLITRIHAEYDICTRSNFN